MIDERAREAAYLGKHWATLSYLEKSATSEAEKQNIMSICAVEAAHRGLDEDFLAAARDAKMSKKNIDELSSICAQTMATKEKGKMKKGTMIVIVGGKNYYFDPVTFGPLSEAYL